MMWNDDSKRQKRNLILGIFKNRNFVSSLELSRILFIRYQLVFFKCQNLKLKENGCARGVIESIE